MEILLSLIFIFILLLLSAFFSGSETALTSASKPQLHIMEKEGDWRAAKVNQLFEAKEKLISAILLGNNLVNITASAIATALLIDLFGKSGVAYATILMTLLVLIFSEVLPKSYALHHSIPFALRVAPIMRIIVSVLNPLVTAIEYLVSKTLSIFGIKLEPGLAHLGNEEEVRGAIELYKGTDPDIEKERVMLNNILDLNDVEVGEIMIHRQDVFMIDGTEPSDQLMQKILESSFTRIPITNGEDENIIGILHAKDILRALNQSSTLNNVDLLALVTKAQFIPDTTKLLDQLQAFKELQEHLAIVVDEYGSFMGIVTLEDILEEIVGDISDEHDDKENSQFKKCDDGSYIIEGTVTIRDLNREYQWDLPDEDASTIAGLLIHESRNIPDVGQIFEFFGYRFKVLKRKRNQITLIQVIPLEN